jgi:hypothetical protein
VEGGVGAVASTSSFPPGFASAGCFDINELNFHFGCNDKSVPLLLLSSTVARLCNFDGFFFLFSPLSIKEVAVST